MCLGVSTPLQNRRWCNYSPNSTPSYAIAKLCNCITPREKYKDICIAKHNMAMRLHIEENICNCTAIGAATHETFFLSLCNCILGRPFDLELCKCTTPSEKYRSYCIAKHIIAMQLHIEKKICNCKAKDGATHETFFLTLCNSI